jgi:hypothetical protein
MKQMSLVRIPLHFLVRTYHKKKEEGWCVLCLTNVNLTLSFSHERPSSFNAL